MSFSLIWISALSFVSISRYLVNNNKYSNGLWIFQRLPSLYDGNSMAFAFFFLSVMRCWSIKTKKTSYKRALTKTKKIWYNIKVRHFWSIDKSSQFETNWAIDLILFLPKINSRKNAKIFLCHIGNICQYIGKSVKWYSILSLVENTIKQCLHFVWQAQYWCVRATERY